MLLFKLDVSHTDMPKKSACQLYHEGREGGPCTICKESKPRYWHMAQATPKHTQLVITLRQRNISDSDCICYACQQRLRSGRESVHLKRPVTKSCQLPNCKSEIDVHGRPTKNINPKTLQDVFKIDEASAIELCSSTEILFCHVHYCALTNKILFKTCPLCLTSGLLDSAMRAYRDPSVVIEYAKCRLQKDIDFRPGSVICSTCYKAVSRYASGPEHLENLKTSKKHLSHLLQPFRNVTCENYDQCDTYSFSKALVFLCTDLMNDKAMLLETVYDFYSVTFDTCLSSLPTPHTGQKHPAKQNKFQFLSKVKSAVGQCIIASHVSDQRRLGTLIRRCGTDVLTCLHASLFYFSREKKDLQMQVNIVTKKGQLHPRQFEWTYFSDNLAEQIASTAKSMQEEGHRYNEVDSVAIEEEIKKLPPLLWNFVYHSTLSDVEKKQLLLKGDFSWSTHYLQHLHLSSTISHKKMLKRFFICASLLYTHNDSCISPIHLALADVIDRFTSSSSTCFQYLSSFGVTVSKSTFQRFQTQIAAQEMSKKPTLLSESFAVASVDNIDRSASYAAVSAGRKDRGFHGTSIQAVAPLPSSSQSQIPVTAVSDINVPSSSHQIDEMSLNKYHHVPSCFPTEVPASFHPLISDRSLNIDSFSLTENEAQALNIMKSKIFCYMVTKYVSHSEGLDIVLPDLKVAVTQLTPGVTTEQSCVHYTCILAEPADNLETIRHAIDILHEKHNVGKGIKHLLVAGDAKTYEYMLEAKRVYGSDLDWLLPYLGEWHLMKNVQAPLMKLYNDAGLKNLLSMFHRGATHAAVASASGFKKTHMFLIQVWEAFYRNQIETFAKHEILINESSKALSFQSIVKSVKDKLIRSGANVFHNFNISEISTIFHNEFIPFFNTMGIADATSNFWHNFIHRDMFHYASLFLAIRLRQFPLCTAAVRMLTPIFHAMDRPVYLKLVPFHLAELKQFPPNIFQQLERGAFAVSISGHDGCCVALDEAHEMLINKEFKMAMNSTSMGSMSRLLHYLPYRSRVLKNLKDQIGSASLSSSNDQSNMLSLFKQHEENVSHYVCKLREAAVLFKQGQQPDHISHIFTGEVSSDVVSQDLQSFYEKGEEDLQAYIKCVVLNTSGTKPPKRSRRNLKTFATKRKTLQKQSYELKDQKLQILSLRRQVALSKATNQPVECLFQFVSLPRAISYPDGLPFKASKARSAAELQKRYPCAFFSKLPSILCNKRTCCVIEGMFMVNCPPLGIHKTFAEYAHFLYRRWVVKAVREFGASEVHVIFDHPGRHGISPKDIERQRRNSSIEEASYTEIVSNTLCPSNWRKFLSVRSQKRLLVNFLSMELLQIAQHADLFPQLLVTAGGFDGVNTDRAFQLQRPPNVISEVSGLSSNHEEGDSRVWFHSSKSLCERVVIYSPDRDTFHVGLPVVSNFVDKQVYVQLRAAKNDNLFICMNTLVNMLRDDLALQKVGPDMIPHIPLMLQILYVASGCDFTSFFKGHSKKGFLDVFIRDCEFITGSNSTGKLDDSNEELSLLAFYRLIGSVYFRKYSSAFEADSPRELFVSVSVPGQEPLNNHTIFLSAIRDGHFHRISGESEWMPSTEALRLHWQRCCWVVKMWAQACSSHVLAPEVTSHGWKICNGEISFVWDTDENLQRVNSNIQHLKEGCKCKKGCTRNWCKCKKAGKTCSLFCACRQCENKTESANDTNVSMSEPITTQPLSIHDTYDSESESDSSTYEDCSSSDIESASGEEASHSELGDLCSLSEDDACLEDKEY